MKRLLGGEAYCLTGYGILEVLTMIFAHLVPHVPYKKSKVLYRSRYGR
ncbi:MAG: hypothetical protein LBK06_07255 [Planctomycetaceae bacterium]|nr:hypothetical protein [Planctomycetaceae bacterium]